MYLWTENVEFLVLIVFVDDIQMFGSTDEANDVVMEHFRAHFDVHVDDSVTPVFCFPVEDRGDRVKLRNAPMEQRLLKSFKMDHYKSSKTLLPLGLDLRYDTSEKLGEATPYRQLIGALSHLAHMVRPDISYAVGYLSCFSHAPTDHLWKAGKHVLRYLKGTGSLSLVYRAGGEWKIEAFSDLDWGQARPRKKVDYWKCYHFCWLHDGLKVKATIRRGTEHKGGRIYRSFIFCK